MRLSCLPVMAAIISTGQAWAQSSVLEEVVVTAQKRKQSLQEVPISISVMTGAQIKDLKINNAKDLSNYIPNFSVIRDPIGDKINIRGVQSGNLASFEQSVSTYVDGVYRGRGAQSRLSYMDVGSVEVLRGPQGALFGKNTIGGAVNISSARPTQELAAELSGSYNTEFDGTDINGFVSGGITDSLRGRFAFQDRKMDEGWMRNSFYGQDIPQTDDNGGRAMLEWDVTDATQVMLKYEYSRWHNVGQPWTLITTGHIPGVQGGVKYNGITGNDGRYVVDVLGKDPSVVGNTDPIEFGSNNFSDGDNNESMLRVEHQFENQSVFTAIAAYSSYDFKRSLDADYNPLPGLRYDDSEDYEQSSLELRFTSNTGDTLEYLAGLYYQHDSLDVDGLGLFNGIYLDDFIGDQCADGGGTPQRPDSSSGTDAYTAKNCDLKVDTNALVGLGLEGANRYHYMKQDTDSYAAFGQLTWNIRDDLRTTAGLRYTYEEKTAHQGAWAADYEADNSQQTFDPVTVLVAEAIGEFTTHDFNDLDRDDEVVTWSLNVQWDASADTMLYSSVSTGFKSGGFNSFYLESAGGIASPDDAEFNKEKSPFSAEIGAKMILADGAADLNIAVFYSKFDDLQAAIFAGSTSFIVQNAARADTRGVEIDGRWQLTDQLLLTGSAAYLDFTYDNFPNQACTNEQFEVFRENDWDNGIDAAATYTNQDCAVAGINDVAGQTSENNPKWQANMIAQHILPIGDFELMSLLALTYQDAQYRQGDLDPILKDEQYMKVDLSLMFGPASGRWEVAVIGRNLTDQTTYSYGNDAPFFEGARQVYVDQPRNYALRATVRY